MKDHIREAQGLVSEINARYAELERFQEEHRQEMLRLEAEHEARQTIEDNENDPGEPSADTMGILKRVQRELSKTLRIPQRDIRLALDKDCIVGVVLQDRVFPPKTFDVFRAENLRCCINVVEKELVTPELRALSPWRAWRWAFKICVATVRMG